MQVLGLKDIIVMAVGTAFLLLWLVLYAMGKKNEDLFNILEDEDYPMKDLYFVGYALCEKLHIDYKQEKHQKTRRQLGVLYGRKYIDYYMRAIYAQRYTMSLTILCLALPAYCFTEGSLLIFGVIIAAAGAAYYYYGTTLGEKIQKRQDTMLEEFATLVSKLALLVNAGMILHDAWIKVSSSGEGELYDEMRTSVEEMRNGIPEKDAVYSFGQRCMLPEVKKFSSTLIQGMERGSAELCSMLTAQSKEVWMLKQQIMRRKGEKANSKLLIPILLVFIGILIMVIVPIFSGLGV